MGRPAVLAGMTIAMVILTAGCTGTQPTTTPPATTVTTASTPTASQTATSAMVHRVLGHGAGSGHREDPCRHHHLPVRSAWPALRVDVQRRAVAFSLGHGCYPG